MMLSNGCKMASSTLLGKHQCADFSDRTDSSKFADCRAQADQAEVFDASNLSRVQSLYNNTKRVKKFIEDHPNIFSKAEGEKWKSLRIQECIDSLMYRDETSKRLSRQHCVSGAIDCHSVRVRTEISKEAATLACHDQ